MPQSHPKPRPCFTPRMLAVILSAVTCAGVVSGCAESRSRHWAQTAPLIQAGGTELAVFDGATVTASEAERRDDSTTVEN